MKREAFAFAILATAAVSSFQSEAQDSSDNLDRLIAAAELSDRMLDQFSHRNLATQAYDIAQLRRLHIADTTYLPVKLRFAKATEKGPERLALLTSAYQEHIDTYGPSAPETLDALYELADATTLNESFRKGRKLLKKAGKLIEKLHGNESLEFATHLLKMSEACALNGSPTKGLSHARKAAKLMKMDETKAGKLIAARSHYWAAQNLALKGHDNSANEEFLAFTQSITEVYGDSFMDLSDQVKLVTTYVMLEEDERATDQSLAISIERARHGYNDAVVLYEPVTNVIGDAYKGGYVKAKFVVGVDGIPENVEIIEREGHPYLEGAAISTIEKSRYAPQFEEGSPITSGIIERTLTWLPHGTGAYGMTSGGLSNLGPSNVSSPRRGAQRPSQ